MKVFANAKINLSLDIVSKRPDGYHDVCMIMQEIDLHDEIVIEEKTGDAIELICDKLPGDSSNIAYKAAVEFYNQTGIRKHCIINLKKNIPVCAGLGGGSSDAAAVLKALNLMNGGLLTDEQLCDLGLKLGADVPFFIKGGTSLAEGIGEKLTPLRSFTGKYIVLIKPDADISTAVAYREADSEGAYHPDTKSACCCIDNGNFEDAYDFCGNTFEKYACSKYPQIEEIKKHLYECGAEFSMMSGSGPTVFGIFESENRADEALKTYNASYQFGTVAAFV